MVALILEKNYTIVHIQSDTSNSFADGIRTGRKCRLEMTTFEIILPLRKQLVLKNSQYHSTFQKRRA